MATLQAAPTRHRHTEQFSGILTNQYLPGPYLKREGGRDGWEKPKHKLACKQQAIEKHFAKNCKQATVYTSHSVPLLKALGHPQYSRKNC